MRLRLIKNFIATLYLSQGIPMLLSGDEFRRTQGGNNNAYCQDNEISWVDWRLIDENRELFRFTREMIRFRKSHPVLRREGFFTGTAHSGRTMPDLTWHGHEAGMPDWGPGSNEIAMLINGEYAELSDGKTDTDLYVIFNASRISRKFDIPDSPSGRGWKVAIDTSKNAPDDIHESGPMPLLAGRRFHVKRLSTVVLIAED
jgi:glycogen operon protein